jgi:glycerol-3-phosphate dehydrogenase
MIAREPEAAAAIRHDLAVVGGGIHGVSIALEAVRRGLHVVLLESGDFGGGASGNSLRILHGGLRYLQTLDLVRFRESVAERRWYARNFPALVAPLPCLMPLYGRGLKRRAVMRIALTMNDRLSMHRNDGVAESVRLPSGATFGVQETRARFEAVRPDGLEGSAFWYDYQMRSSERILIEMLHSACASGGHALNYIQAERVVSVDGKVSGVAAVDRINGRRHTFQAERVCNATGSNARVFAASNDREAARLFVPSLAFNVLFDCAPLSQDALAVAAPEAGAPVYFLCPSPFGLWAGTVHVGRPDGCTDPSVRDSELLEFIQRLNRAIPAVNLSLRNVRRVFSGLLPVRTAGSTDLTAREVIINHGDSGGLTGLFSVTGIKFTTARKVGERAVNEMLGSSAGSLENAHLDNSISPATEWLLDGARVADLDPARAEGMIREVAREESAINATDFCLRRTNWAFSAPDFSKLEHLAARALGATTRSVRTQCAY